MTSTAFVGAARPSSCMSQFLKPKHFLAKVIVLADSSNRVLEELNRSETFLARKSEMPTLAVG